MTIGVFVEGEGDAPARIVQRPYSVASDPGVADDEGYELYIRLVEGGLFTPLLWRLPLGHRMRMIGPKGKFTLEPEDDRTHLFITSPHQKRGCPPITLHASDVESVFWMR